MTIDEIENIFKDWLRRSSDRLKKSKKGAKADVVD